MLCASRTGSVVVQRQASAARPCSVQSRPARTPSRHLQHIQRGVVIQSKRATAEDEKTIEEMKRQLDGKDAFEGAQVGQTVKIGLAVVAASAVFAILWLAQPVINNTIGSFPTAS